MKDKKEEWWPHQQALANNYFEKFAEKEKKEATEGRWATDYRSEVRVRPPISLMVQRWTWRTGTEAPNMLPLSRCIFAEFLAPLGSKLIITIARNHCYLKTRLALMVD